MLAKFFHQRRVVSGSLFVLLCLTPTMRAQQAPVFEDDFSGSKLDSKKWDVQTYAGHNQGTFRADPDFYNPDAVSISNHTLQILTERFPITDPKSGVAYPLRSGRIQTKQAFLYGKFVIRAKLPSGAGMWPALWLRTPFGQPFNGEIDIAEGHGSHPNVVQSTLHHWNDGKEQYQDCSWLVTTPQPSKDNKFRAGNCKRIDNIPFSSDLASAFHTYTLEWLPTRVTWFLDGQKYFEVTNNIPQTPMVIVISQGFSHNWDGGSPDTAQLPQSLQVNFVRVYDLPH